VLLHNLNIGYNIAVLMSHQKTTSALQIADYLILKAKTEGVPMTNKRLQKLLYYVQAWSAALKNEKVFSERIEAWIHGPAIKEVYFEYRKFGADPIKKDVTQEMVSEISTETKNLIDEVWSVYSKYDTAYLEYLTHSETPWQIARQGLEPHISSEKEITFESMRDFYSKLKIAKTA